MAFGARCEGTVGISRGVLRPPWPWGECPWLVAACARKRERSVRSLCSPKQRIRRVSRPVEADGTSVPVSFRLSFFSSSRSLSSWPFWPFWTSWRFSLPSLLSSSWLSSRPSSLLSHTLWLVCNILPWRSLVLCLRHRLDATNRPGRSMDADYTSGVCRVPVPCFTSNTTIRCAESRCASGFSAPARGPKSDSWSSDV